MNADHLLELFHDDPIRFRSLIQRPRIAWLTLILFVSAIALYTISIWWGISHQWRSVYTVALNTICAYTLFTVIHDASHRSISTHSWLNDVLGRISTLILFALPMFSMFRYVHMQHHRFANESEDPDMWVGCATSTPSLLVRGATMDLHYTWWYVRRMSFLPRRQRIDAMLSVFVGISMWIAIIYCGWWSYLLLYWLLPSRIAILVLAIAFDYWPHSPYKATTSQNKFQATNIRIGWEPILTPLLLSQNYHLVHHLYPVAPFYRYRALWRARERYHILHNPLLRTIYGTELTVGEYWHATRHNSRCTS